MNTELIKDIEKVIDNLKLSNKKNLSNIFLQIKDNENNEIINLDTGLIEKNNINKKSNLIIKMTLETFNSIKNNKKILKIYYSMKK